MKQCSFSAMLIVLVMVLTGGAGEAKASPAVIAGMIKIADETVKIWAHYLTDGVEKRIIVFIERKRFCVEKQGVVRMGSWRFVS